MKRLKVGVVGTSNITRVTVNLLNEELKHKYDVIALYTRNIEHAKKVMTHHTITYVDTDYQVFLAREDVEIVYVASPNHMHFEQVMQALQHKKHVIVEKPAFETVEQWDKAYALAHKNQVFLIEAIRNVYEPTFDIAKKIVNNLKQIDGAFWNFQQYSSKLPDFYKGKIANVFSLESSGGALMDLGIYTLYPAIAFFGYPKNYQYISQKLSTGVDGSGTIILNYENFDVTIRISKCTHSDLRSEIYSKNVIYSVDKIDGMTDFTKTIGRDEKVFSQIEDGSVLYQEWLAFYKIIAGNQMNVYKENVALGRQVVQLMQALRYQADILFDVDKNLDEIKEMTI